jgi:hypothetical protein
MKKAKDNWGLLNQSRFAQVERERIRRLQGLTWKKAIQLEEQMLSSKLILEWRNNFSKDKPVSLKESLHRKRKKR